MKWTRTKSRNLDTKSCVSLKAATCNIVPWDVVYFEGLFPDFSIIFLCHQYVDTQQGGSYDLTLDVCTCTYCTTSTMTFKCCHYNTINNLNKMFVHVHIVQLQRWLSNVAIIKPSIIWIKNKRYRRASWHRVFDSGVKGL